MTKVALLSFLRMLLCGCVLLFLGSVLAHPLNEMSLDAQWDSWKTTHLREYNGLVSVCLSGCLATYSSHVCNGVCLNYARSS